MLSERQQLILATIVESFIENAEPIGSRTISRQSGIGFSAATIRNEMADLEEMGYLEQPHASAGRIPTNKGYRYYVDNLVKPRKLDQKDIRLFQRYFTERIYEIEKVFQQTAIIISELTNYTSIVLGPETCQHRLKHLQIVPLSDRKAVAIMVTDTGHVEDRSVSIPEGMSVAELERLVNILNDKLTGLPLNRIRSELYVEIANELSRYAEQYEELLNIVDQMLESDANDRVFMGGATNLMVQPEFRDVEKVKLIFDLFEDQDIMHTLFWPERSGIQVSIGHENQLEAISNCSIITTTYVIDGEKVGSISVLGPTRMDYSRLIGLMEFLSDNFTKIIRPVISD